MAPQYKVTYFNGRGLAEPIRYILSYAGVDFEDVRVTGDTWPELKAKIGKCSLYVKLLIPIVFRHFSLYTYFTLFYFILSLFEIEQMNIENN